MSAPIEVTTKYVTSVDTLPEAWAFVMEYVDRVGPRPQIEIGPVTVFDIRGITDGDPGEGREIFEVTVSGMVPQDGAS